MSPRCIVSNILQIFILIEAAHATPSPITTTSNYHYVPVQKTWSDAEKYCNDEFGSNLGSIHNAGQNVEVSNLCKANTVSSWCWIGLNDIENERYKNKTEWTWSDGSSFDFDSWGSAQPDSITPREDCVETNWAGIDKFWNDIDCNKGNAFVCNRYNPATTITTAEPTLKPTAIPTINPTNVPSIAPSFAPSLAPSLAPTLSPITTSNYHFVSTSRTWSQAESYCRNNFGTNLGSIHNADENEEVLALFKSKASQTWCYIGLNDIDNERYRNKTDWTWSDGSTFDYYSWGPGEPENGAELQKWGYFINLDCVQMDRYGSWGDSSCGNARPFVCNRYDRRRSPTTMPTLPTVMPTTSAPVPTSDPSEYPTDYPTTDPSNSPTSSPAPTLDATSYPSSNPTLEPTSNPTLSPSRPPSQYPSVNLSEQNIVIENNLLTGSILFACGAILFTFSLGALIYVIRKAKAKAEDDMQKTVDSVNDPSTTHQNHETDVAKVEMVADSNPAIISTSADDNDDDENSENLFPSTPKAVDNVGGTTANDGEEGGSNGYGRIKQILKLIYNDEYEIYLQRFKDEMIDDFMMFEDNKFRSILDEKDEFWEKIMPQRGARIKFFRYVNEQSQAADV